MLMSIFRWKGKLTNCKDHTMVTDMYPPDFRILEGSFDNITSISVLEFGVILVGSLINC